MRQKSLVLIATFMLLASCNGSPSSATTSSTSGVTSDPSTSMSSIPLLPGEAAITEIPDGVARYEDAALYIADREVPLYAVKVNLSQTWDASAPNRVDTGLAIVRINGPVTMTVQCHYSLSKTYTKVRPLGENVPLSYDLDNNRFSFILSNTGKYTIEPNGDRTKTIHLIVNELTDETVDTTAANVIYFGPGLHDASNDTRLAGDSTITLQSGQTVILDDGAVVRGRFEAYQATNIAIIGGGIIDGSTFPRVANVSAFIPIDFDYCTGITFRDFTITDPAGWTVNWYFDTDSTIDNINLITSRSNGDGISLQSCQNITVTRVFARTWDDSLVVKNYPRWSNTSQHGTTRNILFQNCILWTDLAQSMEIGYETVGTVLEDVTFDNIIVLHNFHKPVISIHNGNDAAVKNITYRNITVEAASMGSGDAGSNKQLIQFNVAYSATWSDQHAVTALGSIDGVNVTNLNVLDGNEALPIDIEGCMDTRTAYYGSTHFVSHVTLTDMAFKGTRVSADYPYLTTNAYTADIAIVDDGASITGATWPRRWSASELALYDPSETVFTD